LPRKVLSKHLMNVGKFMWGRPGRGAESSSIQPLSLTLSAHTLAD